MTEVRPARDAGEVRAALALRHEVFVVEQGVPLEEEIDEHDETDALHLVATEDGHVVATARVVMEAETTRGPVARATIETIERFGGKVLGLVFNKRRFYIPRWIYRRL